jgi:hypothetical protein
MHDTMNVKKSGCRDVSWFPSSSPGQVLSVVSCIWRTWLPYTRSFIAFHSIYTHSLQHKKERVMWWTLSSWPTVTDWTVCRILLWNLAQDIFFYRTFRSAVSFVKFESLTAIVFEGHEQICVRNFHIHWMILGKISTNRRTSKILFR